jgi:cyanate permease
MCLLSTVAAVGPAVGGWAKDAFGSFEGLFLVCGGVTAAMFLATFFLKPPMLKGIPAPAVVPAE